MKISIPILLGAALMLGSAAPALASPKTALTPQYQSDQERDRNRNTQAYSDGYAQGQADARAGSARNEQPTSQSQWTRDDDLRAYRQGYDAGYEAIRNAAPRPSEQMGHGEQQAGQFGYQDGLAAGRQDRMKGDKFKPEDHDLYKDANHGWTAELGTKAQFKQLYREGYVRGYQEGYSGSGPR